MDMSRYIILLLFIGLAWGQDCTASDGTDGVTIMGECYSILNTTFIDRSWDNLPGTIPPGIGLLTNLTYLDLCCNQLTGDIPPEIGNLINLTHLNLQWNQLNSIPPEIGNLTNLTFLNLQMAVTGPHIGNAIPPEIGNLINLTFLDLSDNELGCHNYNWLGNWENDNCNEHCDETDECSANIPPEIGNLTQLTFLDLTDNHLSGEIPSEIGNLVNLTSLSLWDNDLSGEIPESIGNLNNLKLLWLKENQLSGSIPSTIGNLTELGSDESLFGSQPGLDLSYNQLTGPIPSSIGNLTELVTMNLGWNQLTGPIPPEIGDMTSLIFLDLRHNQLNGEIPSELANLNSINQLWLGFNNLRGQIPDELCNIDVCGSECNNMSYVFTGNNLCPPYPECFTEMNTAENTIDIIYNQLCNPYPECPAGHTGIANPPPINGGEIYDGWCFNESDLENLQDFIDVNDALSGSPIEIGEQSWMGGPTAGGHGFAYEYFGYGSLSSLDFSNENNEISIIPESIGNLDELEFVDFSNTQITTIPASLGDLSELSKIWWENGQLTGFIPPELGNLTNLTGLKLNDNQLTGSIPAELGNTNLHYLYLNRNQLTGEVPLEIWNLEAFYELSGNPYENGGLSLRTINLRHNQLSGILSESLCDINLKWNSWNFVDLRNNNFCPTYPSCLENKMGQQDTSNCSQASIIEDIAPITYNLYNAYPNPFNPITTLRYDLPEDANVSITIYNMMGRQVSTLVSSQQNAGFKSVRWNATNDKGAPVSAGLYLYMIQAGEFRQTKKMVLLK